MDELFQFKTKVFIYAWLCLVVTVFAGCTKQGPTVSLGTLTGVVYSGKEVMSNCRVKIFNNKTLESRMVAIEEEGGRYEFKDIAMGDYSVAVVQEAWYEASTQPHDKRIPMKYRDYNKSGFSTTVKQGQNEYNIEMKR